MTIWMLTIWLLAAPNVELTPLEGEPVRGVLHRVGMDGVALESSGEKRNFPGKAIEKLKFTGTPINDYSQLRVKLADGSELRPSQVTLTGGKLQCDFGGSDAFEIPVKQVHSVKFKRQSNELERQWNEIEKGVRASDLVVVRRKSIKTASEEGKPVATEESLDFVDGSITGMSADSVEFDLGDDQSSLKRDRLDGVIFGRRGATSTPTTKMRVTDASGSRWNLNSFTSQGDELELHLAGGGTRRLPEREVAAIDFSPGNVLYLDADAADLTETSFDLVPAALKSSTERLFQPRRISPGSSISLRLGPQTYSRGLLLHGETKLMYAVPAGYRRFTAMAGLPHSASKQARATLTIAVDNQAPWEQAFSAKDRGPFPIDLPVSGAKRLTIRLQDTEGLDISDQVLICKARFLQ
jgi:hypothetical protein